MNFALRSPTASVLLCTHIDVEIVASAELSLRWVNLQECECQLWISGSSLELELSFRKVDILAILIAAYHHIHLKSRVVRAVRLDYHCKNDCLITLGDFFKPVLSPLNNGYYIMLLTPTEVVAALEVSSSLQLQVRARHIEEAIGG